jgi:hypothetical protein
MEIWTIFVIMDFGPVMSESFFYVGGAGMHDIFNSGFVLNFPPKVPLTS